MIKKWWMFSICIVLIVAAAVPVRAAAASHPLFVHVIVAFQQQVDEQAVTTLQGNVTKRFDVIPAVAATVPITAVELLRRWPGVDYVQQDTTVAIDRQVIDWGVEKTKASVMHPQGVTGKGVKIAILDTGVDPSHPDLRVAGGVCLLSSCPHSYQDDNGHGTHVAGIIAAKDNEIGTVGVAPDASIYAVKVLDRYGEGNVSAVLSGIEWAIEHDIDIINLSLAAPEDAPALKAAIQKAYESGILVVAAAGNNGYANGAGDTVEYPAKYDSAIAVAAVNKENVRLPYSATGPAIEVAAPGEDVYSTVPVALDRDGVRDGYTRMSGTSMAVPFVSGVLALYKQQYPERTNLELRQMLRGRALDLGAAGKDPWYGYGLVQAVSNQAPELTVKLLSVKKGEVAFSVTPTGNAVKGYRVYRNGKRLETLQTAATYTDYVVKGIYEYEFASIRNDGTESALSAPITVNVPDPDYKDLSASAWYMPEIVYLSSQGIVSGYNNGTIQPYKTITRAEVAVMLGRALHLDGTKRATVFRDVSSSDFASGYIQAAYEHGLINGYPDGTFRPQHPITRAETAIMLSRAYPLPDGSSMMFKDVTTRVTGHEAIAKLAAARITEGYPDGTFRPYQFVKRLEFFVFTARAANERFR
ncbi:S8 family peptidase [Geobacillus subterraneus]|uniref:S8 family peptidase n=1 Tax=Geobacillus subterraneus TaxID=129338 RepID=UPI001442D4E6|nr:S8 family serine peptidase [Geobacillus subterraneus]QIZ65937.1 S8 family serine peptidase [Geobacillus subterraneus]